MDVELKRGKVEVVSALRAFNLPLYEVFFVIDCRNGSDFTKGHIASALNFPPPDPISNKMDAFYAFAQYANENFCNDRWDPIVIYGDDSAQVQDHIVWLVECLLTFINNPPKYHDGSWFIKCMSQSVQSIWVLEGGYKEFVQHYPLLRYLPTSENGDTGASSMKPLPYHVSTEGGGIFLGSRAIDWTKEMIEGMGIRAVVLDQEASKVFDSEATTTPLVCFLCSLSNNEDHEDKKVTVWSLNRLETLFEYATEFIQNAVQQHWRVLIQLKGRSASAALAIAWYMRYQHLPFDEAKKVLFSFTLRDPTDTASSVLDRSLLFEKELRLWERSARFASYLK